MSKGQTLQDPFLNALRKDSIPVSIFLLNGIKLQGQIESFDQYVVLLKNTVSQMVYKHAISTIVPARNPRTAGEDVPSTGGYQGGSTGTNYPMGGGGFERTGGGYQGGGSTRGGFTRTPNAGGFGAERGGYQGGGFERTGGYEGRGFGGGFDRSSYEERGFDGQGFDNKGFDNKSFDGKGFDSKGFDKDDDSYNG